MTPEGLRIGMLALVCGLGSCREVCSSEPDQLRVGLQLDGTIVGMCSKLILVAWTCQMSIWLV
jgi:hypothetical protein